MNPTQIRPPERIISSRGNPLAGAGRNKRGQRLVSAEQAVRWAFCHELPKSPPVERPMHLLSTSYGSVLDYGALGTLVDGGVNKWGVVADLSCDAFPHDDAIAIGHAVAALDGLRFWPNSRPASMRLRGDSMAPIVRTCQDRVLKRIMTVESDSVHARLRPSSMLVHRAVIAFDPADGALDDVTLDVERAQNGRPAWFLRKWQAVVTGRVVNGKPEVTGREIEIDGWCKTRRAARPGAYNRQVLTPDPTDALVARMEWLMWRDALRALASSLRGKLASMDMSGELPPSPWGDDLPAAMLDWRWWREPAHSG